MNLPDSDVISLHKESDKNWYRVSLLLLLIQSHSVWPDTPEASCNQSLTNRHYAQAINLAQSALKVGNTQTEIYLCLAQAYIASGKPTQAIDTLEVVRKQNLKSEDEIRILIKLGEGYFHERSYDSAVTALKAAQKILQKSPHQSLGFIVNNQLGITYKKQYKLKESLQSYQESRRLAANDNERAEAAQDMAKIYRELGQYDDAIASQIQVLLAQEKIGTLDEYSEATIYLIELYCDASEWEKAEKLLARFHATLELNNNRYWLSNYQYLLFKTRLKSGAFNPDITLLLSAIELAKKHGNNALIGEMHNDVQTMRKDVAQILEQALQKN